MTCFIGYEFRIKIGRNISPKWPVGAAFSLCTDLLTSAANNPGAIGYAELRCGEKSKLSVAHILDTAGEFVKPSPKNIGAVALAME
jgi:ABC-type phosphate transport system substrate-binding protein